MNESAISLSDSNPEIPVQGRRQKGCRHCGLPTEDEFCCAGCATVFATLSELGLLDFYRWRDVGESPKQRVPDAPSSAFDTFTEIEPHAANGLAVYTFEIQGIHCAGCLWILERLSRVQRGISRTALNASTGELTVWFEPEEISLVSIARLLGRLGYPPRDPRERGSERPSPLPLIRMGVAAFAAMNTMMLAVSLFEGFSTGIESDVAATFRWVSLFLSMPVVLWAGLPLYSHAFTALRSGRIHIELPLTVAIVAAFVLSAVNTALNRPYVYFDSVCLLIFLLLVSRAVQNRAMVAAKRASRIGWALLPNHARLVTGEEIELVRIEDLVTGDLVRVAPGERFPADGVVCEGTSSVDRSILNGESRPEDVSVGAQVEAGALNVTADLTVTVRSVGENTRVGHLLAELRHRDSEKGVLGRFTDAVGRWYLAGLGIATLVTVAINHASLTSAIESVLTLYIVTCPCALAFSLPTIYGLLIGAAARRGILVKSAAVLEELVRAKRAFVDKTGTVTTGEFKLISADWLTSDRVCAISALSRLTSLQPNHPVSRAIRVGEDLNSGPSHGCFLVPGRGVQFDADNGEMWRLGSPTWAGAEREAFLAEEDTAVSLTRNGAEVARFILGDCIRPCSRDVVQALHDRGIRVIMLSGDQQSTVRAVAARLGIRSDEAYGEMTPEQKAQIIDECNEPSVFVGDGVNDVLALRAADVGIALAGGLEATVDAADVIVLDGALDKVAKLRAAATRAHTVACISLGVSLVYNLTAAAVTMAGGMNPLIAAFLMPTSSMIVMVLALTYRPLRSREV